MNIKIIETQEITKLSITDQASGCDWTKDFVGNSGALNDGQFELSSDGETYRATQDTFDWWQEACERNETIDKIKQELIKWHEDICECHTTNQNSCTVDDLLACYGDYADTIDICEIEKWLHERGLYLELTQGKVTIGKL